ncbi:hypothetical protein ACJ41O_013970 [Fusarium nematophilum]
MTSPASQTTAGESEPPITTSLGEFYSAARNKSGNNNHFVGLLGKGGEAAAVPEQDNPDDDNDDDNNNNNRESRASPGPHFSGRRRGGIGSSSPRLSSSFNGPPPGSLGPSTDGHTLSKPDRASHTERMPELEERSWRCHNPKVYDGNPSGCGFCNSPALFTSLTAPQTHLRLQCPALTGLDAGSMRCRGCGGIFTLPQSLCDHLQEDSDDSPKPIKPPSDQGSELPRSVSSSKPSTLGVRKRISSLPEKLLNRALRRLSVRACARDSDSEVDVSVSADSTSFKTTPSVAILVQLSTALAVSPVVSSTRGGFLSRLSNLEGTPSIVSEQDPAGASEAAPSAGSCMGSEEADSESSLASADRLSSPDAVAWARRDAVVDCLMALLEDWLDKVLEAQEHLRTHGTVESKSVLTSSGLAPSRDPGSQGQKLGKRPRDDVGNEGGDGDGDDEQGLRRGHPKRGKGADTVPTTRFACPFFKHNQQRYQTSEWKSCCWPGWPTVHRLKEHLYRRHTLPKYRCNRCRQDLKSESSLFEHQRSEVPCPIQAYEPTEGISEEQERLLRSRKKKSGQSSEEAKWVAVYQILFPLDDPIPSPYQDYCPMKFDADPQPDEENTLERFEQYARNEFPRQMRPRVEEMVDRTLSQSLRPEAITELAQTVLSGLLASFRQINRQSTLQVETRSPSAETTMQQPWESDAMFSFFDDPSLEQGLLPPVDFDINQ